MKKKFPSEDADYLKSIGYKLLSHYKAPSLDFCSYQRNSFIARLYQGKLASIEYVMHYEETDSPNIKIVSEWPEGRFIWIAKETNLSSAQVKYQIARFEQWVDYWVKDIAF